MTDASRKPLEPEAAGHDGTDTCRTDSAPTDAAQERLVADGRKVLFAVITGRFQAVALAFVWCSAVWWIPGDFHLHDAASILTSICLLAGFVSTGLAALFIRRMPWRTSVAGAAAATWLGLFDPAFEGTEALTRYAYVAIAWSFVFDLYRGASILRRLPGIRFVIVPRSGVATDPAALPDDRDFIGRLIAVAFAVGALLTVILLLRNLRPMTPLETVLDSMAADWQSSPLAAVTPRLELFGNLGLEKSIVARFDALARMPDLPPLRDSRIIRRDEWTATSAHAFLDGSFEITWHIRGRRRTIERFDYSNLFPPLRTIRELLVEAWNTPGFDALAPLLPTIEKRDDVRRRLEKRNWLDSRPRISDVEIRLADTVQRVELRAAFDGGVVYFHVEAARRLWLLNDIGIVKR